VDSLPSDRAGERKPSLRTELLLNLAVLAAGALVLAAGSALLAPLLGVGRLGATLLVALIAGDVLIFIAFGRYLVTRLVTGPMETLVAATEAVAAGELERRAPPGNTREFERLGGSVNRMTERLLDAQGALVRAEKLASVGRLAAGIAHEVGNPLAAIGNYTEVLKRRGGDAEILAAIEREAGRIDAIVRSLLAYASPREALRQELDLPAVVDGAVDLLRAQGLLRHVHVHVAVNGGVPAVFGEGTALEQVFVNLLLNAVDAVGGSGDIVLTSAATMLGGAAEPSRRATDPADSGAARERRERRTGRHLEGVPDGTRAAQVVVGDSGPGIPPDLVPRIFDPFVTSKPPGKGTGLGLAIVQRIVQDHGGRVDVERAREGGAAFIVTLPAHRP
jgi:hypothetical protein